MALVDPEIKTRKTTSRNNSSGGGGGGVGTSSRRGRRPVQEQQFSSYLTFGFQATVCLCLFVVTYVFVMLSLSPLLSQEAPQYERSTTANGEPVLKLPHGQVLRPVMDPLVETMKHLPHEPLLAIKERLQKSRQAMGLTDGSLLQRAIQDIEHLRRNRNNNNNNNNNGNNNNLSGAAGVAGDAMMMNGGGGGAALAKDDSNGLLVPAAPAHRSGFVVLGMHRSGTSMLSGLLVIGCGYQTGGPLIGSKFDNEKGFFERIDVVLQNDEFMNHQKVWWSANVMSYRDDIALKDKKDGNIPFQYGKTALKFLNNPANAPWLQKDPRMCITLKTWLPLLNNEPAVLFTYRHPLEVAMSLQKREKNFSLERGLRLWIVYNMRAIQNSEGLCRVYSSNDAIMADPLNEVLRITHDLTTHCGVPAPLRELTQEDVDKFVDPTLQHNRKAAAAAAQDKDKDNRPVIQDFNGCIVHSYPSSFTEGTPDYDREHRVYMMAMKIYCDFQTGEAYQKGYEWPELH